MEKKNVIAIFLSASSNVIAEGFPQDFFNKGHEKARLQKEEGQLDKSGLIPEWKIGGQNAQN